MLSLRSTTSASRVAGPCRARPAPRAHTAVVPRAGVSDIISNIGDAFVRIFSPAKDEGVSWEGTTNAFSGRIAHHGAGRPFKDGFVAKDAAQAAAAQTPEGEDYMGGAVQNLMAHNFTGDDTEPPANTGSAGWKGDIHGRKNEGFHARKL